MRYSPRRILYSILCGGTVIAFGPAIAIAQTAAPTTPAAGAGVSGPTEGAQVRPSAQDVQFVKQAAAGGIAEVQAGQLAASKAKNTGVQQFAHRMITDHTKVNDQLMSIAQSLGLTGVPTRPDPTDASAMAKLRRESGSRFERDYIRNQVAAHQRTIKLFQTEAQSGTNPELKHFAQQTLPTLQDHLSMAEQLEHSNA